jgi:hypothetical protein
MTTQHLIDALQALPDHLKQMEVKVAVPGNTDSFIERVEICNHGGAFVAIVVPESFVLNYDYQSFEHP